MEGFCRGCLIKYDEPTDLIPYSEKNRRMFVYSTGLQVKRNDALPFQLCKDCYLNLKQSCKFKKQCRSSDKKFKNYLSMKDDGDAVDFCTYLKNFDDSLTLRLPLVNSYNTPTRQQNKDDDNESTCTSIHNFMSDILQGEEMPDSEARIIRELIEEEADILDESLDSHWLQEDMSIASDFRMDFGFSPFSTPRSINNDHCNTPKRISLEKELIFPKEINTNQDMPILDYDIEENITDLPLEIETNHVNKENRDPAEIQNEDLEVCVPDDILNMEVTEEFIAPTENENELYTVVDQGNTEKKFEDEPASDELDYYINKVELKKQKLAEGCSIDRNLKVALENADNKEFSLDKLLQSPRATLNSGASTPTIRNILFGDTLDTDSKFGQCIEKYQPVEGQNNIFDEFLKNEDSCSSIKIKNEEIMNIENDSQLFDDHVNDYKVGDETNQAQNDNITEECDIKPNLDTSKKIEENLTEDETDILKLLQDNPIPNNDADLFKRPFSPLLDKYDLEACLCKICNKKYTSVKNLQIHFGIVHKLKIVQAKKKESNKVTKTCEICGKILSKTSFDRHMNSHEIPVLNKYHCKTCDSYFSTRNSLLNHKTKHTAKITPEKYVCTICGKVSNHVTNHRIHEMRHMKSYQYTCHVCNKGFYRMTDLNEHMRIHSGDRPFSCDHCKKQFSRKYHLVKHMNVHLSKVEYQCKFCKMIFKSQRQRSVHFKTSACSEKNAYEKSGNTNRKLSLKLKTKQIEPNVIIKDIVILKPASSEVSNEE